MCDQLLALIVFIIQVLSHLTGILPNRVFYPLQVIITEQEKVNSWFLKAIIYPVRAAAINLIEPVITFALHTAIFQLGIHTLKQVLGFPIGDPLASTLAIAYVAFDEHLSTIPQKKDRDRQTDSPLKAVKGTVYAQMLILVFVVKTNKIFCLRISNLKCWPSLIDIRSSFVVKS